MDRNERAAFAAMGFVTTFCLYRTTRLTRAWNDAVEKLEDVASAIDTYMTEVQFEQIVENYRDE